MDLQLASFKDLDRINEIERNTNENPWSFKNFESSLNAGNSSIVLKIENEIIGYAFFSVAATDSHLLNITVSKDYQRNGYGKKILEQVVFQSKVLGATVIFLEVRVSNVKAINFYESFGFKRDAIRYNYYEGDPREDALLMSKQAL
tara:strand:- start:720 stop:1157 length:438 start_codon:yes stop_codon:yes gene_type:complete